MNFIIKNAEVYSPAYLGKKDIMIIGDKIIKIQDEITINNNLNFLNFQLIDGSHKYMVCSQKVQINIPNNKILSL